MYDIIPWRNRPPHRWELLKERRLNAKIKSIKQIKIRNTNAIVDTLNVHYSEYDKFLNQTLTIYYDESKGMPWSKHLSYFDSSNNEIASASYDYKTGQFILEDSTVSIFNKNNKIINQLEYDAKNRLKSYNHNEYDSLLNISYNEAYLFGNNRFTKIQEYFLYTNDNTLEYSVRKRMHLDKNNEVTFYNDTIYNKSDRIQYREVKFDSSGNLIEFIDTSPGMKVAKFCFSYDNNDNYKEKIHMIGNEITYRIVYFYNNKLLIEGEEHYDGNNNLKYSYKFIYEYYD
jgi:hypothetical protein